MWEIDQNGKDDEQIAAEGISCMESQRKELGLGMNLRDLSAARQA